MVIVDLVKGTGRGKVGGGLAGRLEAPHICLHLVVMIWLALLEALI
jgi:hypothetical protein